MERWAIDIVGEVQGVGFRPFVHRLATRHRLSGLVANVSGGVHVEVEGPSEDLERFVADLQREGPTPGRIHELSCRKMQPLGVSGFAIAASTTEGRGQTQIAPDLATCSACLAELFDPRDRRHRHPFINCTACGPRFTIITAMPYDRERTTMARFPMCSECQAEYEDPLDRRFHNQGNCCPRCGPRLHLLRCDGSPWPCSDPVAEFARQIEAGAIGAIKGLGGYHLVCAADREDVVLELRRRKQRDEKPFALMVADHEAARALCEINPQERLLLESPSRPIVLLRARPNSRVASSVARGSLNLGIMLPYTPLHHLLLRELPGTPVVMTSGNRFDEPMVHRDDEAVARLGGLGGLADCFLTHDRPIEVRCDDSVTRFVAGQELPLRRARGHAPRAIDLPFACPRPILAVGGQLKSTFALGRGNQAILSQHIGDLDDLQTFNAFAEETARLARLFAFHPAVLAHDLHPDYASTRYALKAAAAGIQLVPVQHHHAHVAACMAEHGLAELVLGVAFDGTGYGPDGTVWGGEFLLAGFCGYTRVARLRCVGMPGGEQAVREPWRMALAHLLDAGGPETLLAEHVPSEPLRIVRRMLERNLNTPMTSSMGRLFDAAASLLGVRQRVSHEGQAAQELEALAATVSACGAYPFDLLETPCEDEPWPVLEVDARPAIRAILEDVKKGTPRPVIARRFHAAIAECIVAVCLRLRTRYSLDAVVLSGGVFLNGLLVEEARGRLEHAGFRVFTHRLVPPSDAGLSLGQLAVAAAAEEAS